MMSLHFQGKMVFNVPRALRSYRRILVLRLHKNRKTLPDACRWSGAAATGSRAYSIGYDCSFGLLVRSLRKHTVSNRSRASRWAVHHFVLLRVSTELVVERLITTCQRAD